MKIRIICSNCGGANVKRDAWAEWNEDSQEWELGTVFDDAYCDDCGGAASLDEKPICQGERQDRFLIISAGGLFWSNTSGWCGDKASATRFTPDERYSFSPPIGGDWILESDVAG